MRLLVKVYIDGIRDRTHEADGQYDEPLQAVNAATHALHEEGVSSVELVKLNADGQAHTPVVP